MNLNLGKFKKIAEDQHSATMQHPAGHQIKIAKKMLDKKSMEELAATPMQHFYAGGEDQGIPADQAVPDSGPMPGLGGAGFDPNAAIASAPISNGVTGSWDTSTPPAQTPQQPAADPYGSQAYSDLYSKGVGEQKAGIQQGAAAEGALGAAQAPLLDQAVQQEQQMMQSYQNHYNDLDQERQGWISDIQNQHIDPTHYLGSMNTGQGIATAIGLMLGGMGGGLTHQGNPALDFINKQIDRDIAAQQVNLGKSETLLNANMRQFGNLKDATDMTRVMMQDAVKNQLGAAAARSQDPLAKSRAQMQMGALDMQTAPVMSQIAMRKALSDRLTQQQPMASQQSAPLSQRLGMQSPGSPANAAAPQGSSSSQPVVDPDNIASQIELMQRSGVIDPAKAEQARKEVSIMAAKQKALALADENIKDQYQTNTVTNLVNPQAYSRLNQLHAQLTPLIMDAAPSKRLTPESAEREIEPFNVGVFQNQNTATTGLQKLKQYIIQQSDDTPTLRGLGLLPSTKIKESAPVK